MNPLFLIVFTALLLILNQQAFSQELLPMSEAVRITLDNNFGVKVAKNEVRIAENNTSKRNNGYLPTVDLTTGATGNLGGSSQQFNNGMEASVSNAFSWGTNASLGANYTILDKTRDYSLEQLKQVVDLTDLQLRSTMESNLLQLFDAYFQVARLTENNNVLEQTLEISQSRLTRVQYQFDYGQGSRLDVLNARVDLQRDSVNLLNSRQELANARRNLNVIMGASLDNTFEVDTVIRYSTGLSENNLLENTRNHVDVLIVNKNLDISEYDLKIIDAGKRPVVGTNASYDYSYQNNAAGAFINSSNSRGINLGLNATWNLFDGGRRNIQEQNTQINIESQLVQKDQLLLELERDVKNAWESYRNALFVLDVERNSLQTNQLNLERTAEQFRIGQVTSLEFRQAQLNLLNAATSYNAAKYNAKIIELQLLQLSGSLLDAEF